MTIFTNIIEMKKRKTSTALDFCGKGYEIHKINVVAKSNLNANSFRKITNKKTGSYLDHLR